MIQFLRLLHGWRFKFFLSLSCLCLLFIFNKLRVINKACFPVNYSNDFYKDIVAQKSMELSKFAYVNGSVVGAICTRVEPITDSATSRHRLYIMTLGVLAAYRSRGVGSELLESVLNFYEENKNSTSADSMSVAVMTPFQLAMRTVDEIRLHVQTSNTDAMDFYINRFGFVKGDLVQNYYQRIVPPDCYVLYKKLR
jgi:ribosomal protein S18 acetylase RimI-like enzyme